MARIQENLFKVEKDVEKLLPPSFYNASILATKILRSEYFSDVFCGLFEGNNNGKHVDKELLAKVLSHDGIFKVDKIRVLQNCDARACTLRETDPFKVFMHPMFLLEMQDREKEAAQLLVRGIEEWPNLLDVTTFFTEPDNASADNYKLNTEHDHVEWNSLVAAAQGKLLSDKKIAAAEAIRVEKAAKLEADIAAAEASRASSGRAVRDRKRSFASTTVTMAPKVPTPSTMTVVQKNTLMTTILLTHEPVHLLMYGLSDALDCTGNTPQKKIRPDDSSSFKDAGHAMERLLFGYSIQHAYSNYYKTPFGVDEILGGIHERSENEYILQPVPEFLTLLDDPSQSVEINGENIALKLTSDTAFKQDRTFVKLGRASERFELEDTDPHSPSVHSPLGGASHSPTALTVEELAMLDAEFPQPAFLRGKA